MKDINNQHLNDFFKTNNLPKSIESNVTEISNQIDTILKNDKLALVTGGKVKKQGVGKTLLWMIQANNRSDIAIFGKSYDFGKGKVNPDDDSKQSFSNVIVPVGFIRFIRENYNLTKAKIDSLEEYHESGVPSDILKKELPDDGKAYDNLFEDLEDHSAITSHNLLYADWVEDKEIIVYEEDPHQVDTVHISKPFIGDKEAFNWNENDIEDVIDVSDKVKQKEGILNDIIEFGIHKEVSENTLYLFVMKLKSLQDNIDDVEESVRESSPEELLDDDWLIDKDNFWRLLPPAKLEAQHRKSNGDWVNPLQYFYQQTHGKLVKKMEKAHSNGNKHLMMNYGSIRKELENIQKLDSDWNRVVNFQKTKGSKGKTVNKGNCLFEDKKCYVTIFRQHLNRLEELRSEGSKVVINYASGNLDLVNRVTDAEKVEIETEGELKTKIRHFNLSYSRSSLTPKKRNLVNSMKKVFDNVGVVSYKDVGIEEDLYFGNVMGRDELSSKDKLIVAGTPRVNSIALAKARLKFFGKFPLEFDVKFENGSYHIKKESRVIEDGMVVGYEDNGLNQTYKQLSLKPKLDAMNRIRKQKQFNKTIYVMGQLPPESYDVYGENNIISYEDYESFFNREISSYMILESDDTEWEIPYYPSSLPRHLYRRYSKIRKVERWQEEMIELINKHDCLTVDEMCDKMDADKTKRTVMRNVKKMDELIYYSSGPPEPAKIMKVYSPRELVQSFIPN